MNVNYYNTVFVSNQRQKEQGMSISSILYNCGAVLSNKSSMYQGKVYNLVLDNDRADQIIHEKKPKKYHFWHKIGAEAGRVLKQLGGYLDPHIKTKHLLVQELATEKPDPFQLRDYTAILIGKSDIAKMEVSSGEGTGAEVGVALGCMACVVMGVVFLVWGLVAKSGVAH